MGTDSDVGLFLFRRMLIRIIERPKRNSIVFVRRFSLFSFFIFTPKCSTVVENVEFYEILTRFNFKRYYTVVLCGHNYTRTCILLYNIDRCWKTSKRTYKNKKMIHDIIQIIKYEYAYVHLYNIGAYENCPRLYFFQTKILTVFNIKINRSNGMYLLYIYICFCI